MYAVHVCVHAHLAMFIEALFQCLRVLGFFCQYMYVMVLCVFILFMLCVYHFTCAVEEIQRRDLMYSQYGQSQAGPQPEESLSYLTLNTGQGLAVSQCC